MKQPPVCQRGRMGKVARRLASLHHELDGPRFKSRGERGQPNCPSLRVGKQAAISIRWMAAVEEREGKRGASCTMAGVRLIQPSAQTTARWFPTVRMGVLRSSNT
jgi:hypothetical protein